MTNLLFIFSCAWNIYHVPNFSHYINFVKKKTETEYYIAKRHDKLSLRYNGGLTFDLDLDFAFYFKFFINCCS